MDVVGAVGVTCPLYHCVYPHSNFFVLVLSFLVAAQNTLEAITGKGADITRPYKAAMDKEALQ